MVRIIAGRAGSGKSRYCADQLRSLAEAGCEKLIVVVPEQYTFLEEQRIARLLGNRLAAGVEVLSFSRFPEYIYTIAGGKAREYITDSGRIVLMNAAIEAVRAKLEVYGKTSHYPEFIDMMLGLVAEQKDYGIRPDDFKQASERVKSLPLQKKLRDLSLLTGAYTALVGQRFSDRMDDLFTAADKLKETAVFEGYHLFFDAFKSFTPSQYALIRQLLHQAETVTFTLCSDNLDDTSELSLFATGNATYHTLRKLCRTEGIPLEPPVCLERKPDAFSEDIGRIEEYLYAPLPKKKFQKPSNIEVYCASDLYAEVDFVARKILGMAREYGMRYRNFAVIARDLNQYASVVEAVFGKYGIPVFFDRKSEALSKPIAMLVFSALDSVLSGFSYANVFSYLKSGITDIPQAEIDLLENYVYAWNIRGKQWTAPGDWTFHPDGFNRERTAETEEKLRLINAVRRKTLAPLLQLAEELSGTDAKKHAAAVYSLLLRLGVPERIEAVAGKLHEKGEQALAQEYEQLWDTLMDTLEQLALTVEEPITASRFAMLLKLVLSKTSIGSVPATVDQVLFGSADRLRTHDIACTILLGFNEGGFPRTEFDQGLLSDPEKKELESFGLELSPTTEKLLFEERFFVYCAFTSAEDRIIITYPKTDTAGKAKNPSYLLTSLRGIFEGLDTVYLDELALGGEEGRLEMIADKQSAFSYMLAHPGDPVSQAVRSILNQDAIYRRRSEEIENAIRQLAGDRRLTDAELAERLYQSRRQSPSSLEKFARCQFGYFCEYGLRLKPREKLDFDGTEIGTFTHYVVEKYLKERESGIDPESRMQMIINRYIHDKVPDMEKRSARFRVLFRRLILIVKTYIKSLEEEMQNSDFIPLFFELKIGDNEAVKPYSLPDGNIRVTGTIDRLDGYEKDGKLYIKIVDYKTYSKKFDLSEVYNGLGLQMLTYLFSVWKGAGEVFGKEIVPAGVVYSPITVSFDTGADRSMTQEQAEDIRRTAAKGTGLLLEDPEILMAMDKTGLFRFLPVKLRESEGSRTVDARSSVASLERFGKLQAFTAKKLMELAKTMRMGEIAVNPYKPGTAGKLDSCAFCKMAEVCRIEKNAEGVRELLRIKPDEFWSRVEGGAANV